MTLNEMREILVTEGLRLTKSLGQNFLHDSNQLARIIAAAELTPADNALEIGPGLGPLTELLLQRAGRVLAIEMDGRLVTWLQKRFADEKHFELRHADALAVLRGGQDDWREWKLVANLPYSTASPMLVELAQSANPPALMVVTLQREVADRIAAQADDDSFGLLSLLIQWRFRVTDSFVIPATCFFPAPDVESACITLSRREEPAGRMEDQKAFNKIVKRGFSQRRKMMFKLLKADWPEEKLREAFARENLSLEIRAEKVTLEQFARLAEMLA